MAAIGPKPGITEEYLKYILVFEGCYEFIPILVTVKNSYN
jgi:hypothetical protein